MFWMGFPGDADDEPLGADEKELGAACLRGLAAADSASAPDFGVLPGSPRARADDGTEMADARGEAGSRV